MPTVLATKKLKENQRSLLLNAGISVVEYNAIKIEFIPFEVPATIENAIFTSQNGVLSIQNSEFRIQNYWTLGRGVAALLFRLQKTFPKQKFLRWIFQ